MLFFIFIEKGPSKRIIEIKFWSLQISSISTTRINTWPLSLALALTFRNYGAAPAYLARQLGNSPLSDSTFRSTFRYFLYEVCLFFLKENVSIEFNLKAFFLIFVISNNSSYIGSKSSCEMCYMCKYFHRKRVEPVTATLTTLLITVFLLCFSNGSIISILLLHKIYIDFVMKNLGLCHHIVAKGSNIDLANFQRDSQIFDIFAIFEGFLCESCVNFDQIIQCWEFAQSRKGY